jgi:16S rRNA processing protein RimM
MLWLLIVQAILYSFYGFILKPSQLYPQFLKSMIEDKATSIERRIHANKYANFSKRKMDPLERTIKSLKEINAKVLESNTLRSTTVPISSDDTKFQSLKNQSIQNRSVFDIKKIQPSDPYSFGYAEIGVIIKSHGIRGEVKLHMTSDIINEKNFIPDSLVYLKKPNRRTPRPIVLNKLKKQIGNIYLLSFQSVISRKTSDALKGYTLYLRKENRPSLKANEYRIRDLVGLTCYRLSQIITNTTNLIQESNSSSWQDDLNLVSVGSVEGVVPPDELCSPELAKLMHSMLEIKLNDVNSSDEGPVLCLVPFVPNIVKEVDLSRRMILLDPPEGLLDLSYTMIEKYTIRGFLPAIATVSDELRCELEMSTVFVDKLGPLV